jgi:fatty-acyl-CoA synthase
MLVLPDEGVCYSDVVEHAEAMAAALARCGVGNGERVAVWLSNSIEWLVTMFATARVGALLVPLNTRYSAPEVEYVLNHSQPRVLVLEPTFRGKHDAVGMLQGLCGDDLSRAGQRWPAMQRVVCVGARIPEGAIAFSDFLREGARESIRLAPVSPDAPAVIQYTSGTTGRPKGAVLRHNGIAEDAYWVGTRIGVRDGDRLFSPLPFFHIAGITLAILVCATHRATLVSTRSFDPELAFEIMEREECQLIGALETICIDLLNCERLHSSRLTLRGGYAPGPKGIARRMRDELGARDILNIFGLSESSPTCAAPDWSDPPDVRTDTVGRPLPGVEIRLVDPESGCECPAGATGEIQVRGFNVMLGYYRDPEQTRRVLDADGWLRSGDMGRIDADGNLCIVGRLKEIIRSGGENFSPVEVEEVLRMHPAVFQAAVVPAPDERWGEVAWAFVQLQPGHSVEESVLQQFCRSRLASFKLPQRVIFLPQLPLTASGKVHKARLKEFGPGDPGRDISPRSPAPRRGHDRRGLE